MRLFIGWELPDRMMEELLETQRKVRGISHKLSLTRSSNMHLTLRFLGEVEESRLSQIQDSLRTVSFEPFVLKLTQVGHFIQRGEHLIWVGLGVSRELVDLKRGIDEVLVPFGFKTEKNEYLPHITIARRVVLNGGVHRLREIQLRETEGQLSEFVLFESRFNSKGVTHRVVESFHSHVSGF